MEIGTLPKSTRSALRHYIIVMAFAIGGLGLLVMYSYPFKISPPFPEVAPSPVSSSGTTTMPSVRSAPIRLQIPSIKLDASFVAPLRLNSDLTVSVPDNFSQVGWYRGGVTPGEIGTAVILGHVDSKTGPAVFYSLGQVKVGDEIRVIRADGVEALFKVTELKRYSQDQFPTQVVYGATDKSVLRLVTCTGIFDHGAQKYSHNLVVFAEHVE